MTTTTNTIRHLVSASLAACTTFVLLSAVVSIGEPGQKALIAAQDQRNPARQADTQVAMSAPTIPASTR